MSTMIITNGKVERAFKNTGPVPREGDGIRLSDSESGAELLNGIVTEVHWQFRYASVGPVITVWVKEGE